VAFGAAVKYNREMFATHVERMNTLRARLLAGLKTPALAEVKVNLPPVCAPHIVSLTLPKIKSETMLHFLSSKGIYVSSGSACSSHDGHLSSGMLSYGLAESEADTTIRVSIGARNTEEDIDAFLAALAEGVGSLIRVRK
jgi:cysteine desulfurase